MGRCDRSLRGGCAHGARLLDGDAVPGNLREGAQEGCQGDPRPPRPGPRVNLSEEFYRSTFLVCHYQFVDVIVYALNCFSPMLNKIKFFYIFFFLLSFFFKKKKKKKKKKKS